MMVTIQGVEIEITKEEVGELIYFHIKADGQKFKLWHPTYFRFNLIKEVKEILVENNIIKGDE